MVVTTWLNKGVGFAGYANEYLEDVTSEYAGHNVTNLRAFMLAGVRETGHMELSRAIKTGRRAELIRIIASYPHAFGIIVPERFRLTSHP